MIGTQRGTELVSRARDTVADAVTDTAESPPLNGDGEYGIFVTLDRDEQLRGCCGYPRPVAPLEPLVDAAAVDAALNDPRFPALTEAELPEITVELTVLSEPTVQSSVTPESISVGKHGLIAARGGRTGLLLPQVAVDHDWTAEQFLQQTCRKAGFSPTAWRDEDVTIETFTAAVFAETEPNGSIINRSLNPATADSAD